MNNKAVYIIVTLVLIGVSFYGGTVYANNKRAAARGQFAFAGGMSGQFGGRMASSTQNTRAAFTNGQIISKDTNSVTIKMQDGSTKIILLGQNTQILKTAAGSAADLTADTTVTVTGTPNSDGSMTASSIQIRPAGLMMGQRNTMRN